MNDPILITGCSTGIGRAVALALLDRGHTVYATARRVDTLADLEAKGARILPLDITNEKSMAAAVRAIETEYGAVGTLINNAGFAKYGAFENVPLDEARRQLETNVFGLARMTQLVLPAMREAGRGRIINVSSMGGRVTFPFGTWYHVSKHSVEALSDTLRQEVRGFGIDVVIMEPGGVRTSFEGHHGRRVHQRVRGPVCHARESGAVVLPGGLRLPVDGHPREGRAAVREGCRGETPSAPVPIHDRRQVLRPPPEARRQQAMGRDRPPTVRERGQAGGPGCGEGEEDQGREGLASSPIPVRGAARRRSRSGGRSRG